jgi:hypothetical protein
VDRIIAVARPEACRGLLERLGVAVADRDARALRQEPLGDRLAEAARGACDDRGAAGEAS